jgi:hypothetical protein
LAFVIAVRGGVVVAFAGTSPSQAAIAADQERRPKLHCNVKRRPGSARSLRDHVLRREEPHPKCIEASPAITESLVMIDKLSPSQEALCTAIRKVEISLFYRKILLYNKLDALVEELPAAACLCRSGTSGTVGMQGCHQVGHRVSSKAKPCRDATSVPRSSEQPIYRCRG